MCEKLRRKYIVYTLKYNKFIQFFKLYETAYSLGLRFISTNKNKILKRLRMLETGQLTKKCFHTPQQFHNKIKNKFGVRLAGGHAYGEVDFFVLHML